MPEVPQQHGPAGLVQQPIAVVWLWLIADLAEASTAVDSIPDRQNGDQNDLESSTDDGHPGTEIKRLPILPPQKYYTSMAGRGNLVRAISKIEAAVILLEFRLRAVAGAEVCV